MAREFSVLVNYTLNGVAAAQSIYKGPHRKHAENALLKVKALGNHGVLTNCTVTFFDGFRIRSEETKTFGDANANNKVSTPVEAYQRGGFIEAIEGFLATHESQPK